MSRRRELAALAEELTGARQTITELRRERDALVGSLQIGRGQYTDLSDQHVDLTVQLCEARAELAGVRAQLAATERQLDAATGLDHPDIAAGAGWRDRRPDRPVAPTADGGPRPPLPVRTPRAEFDAAVRRLADHHRDTAA